jgi:hypothetical protein
LTEAPDDPVLDQLVDHLAIQTSFSSQYWLSPLQDLMPAPGPESDETDDDGRLDRSTVLGIKKRMLIH